MFLGAEGCGEVLWTRGESSGDWSDVDLARGDLVYWRGHTGVMVDERHMLHANATHMAVTRDDLAAMIAHLDRDKDNPVTRIVRPLPISKMRAL